MPALQPLALHRHLPGLQTAVQLCLQAKELAAPQVPMIFRFSLNCPLYEVS